MVSRDPEDGFVIVSVKDPAADFHRRYGEALARADGVCPYPVDGGRGVREDCVPVSALLSLVEDTKGLVDGVSLRIENLFVGTEVEASPSPPAKARGPPDTRRPHLSAI